MNLQNYQRIMGCVAYAFFATGITLLWNVFDLLAFSDAEINGLGIGMSTALGCGVLAVGLKLIKGNNKVLHWAIILSSLKIVAPPISLVLTRYLIEKELNFFGILRSQTGDILVWSLALYASIWLWKNRDKIDDHNQTGVTIPAAPPPTS